MDKNIWFNLEQSIALLQSIATNGMVPGYREMFRRYGKSFWRGMRVMGGYQTVVAHAGLKTTRCFRASDGHVLRSYYEFLFDEYLWINNIPHDIDQTICTDSDCRYDFKIGDVYVEIWGISSSCVKIYSNYSSRRKAKEKLYQKHKLQLLSIEGSDFRRSSLELQSFFKARLKKFGIKSQDGQSTYPVFNRRKLGYWCEATVVKELKEYVHLYKRFPTRNDLLHHKQSDLDKAIKVFGGYRKFAKMLGHTPRTNAYSESDTINAIKNIMDSIGHFPCDRELQEMHKGGLASLIKNHGGYGLFKEMVIGQRDKRPFGYWNNEANIITELKQLSIQLGRFPKYSELGLIAKGVDRNGKGMKYFKEKVWHA